MSGKLFHAPFIEAHPGFKLAVIVERHLEDSKERYPDTKLYRSVEELCADKEIDLVVVNTPNHLHFPQAKLALVSGKHLIVEKPFTLTAQEGEELASLAKSKNLFISVYQNRRYDGDFRAVKNVLHQNLLGELREVEIRYDRYRPDPGRKQHKEGDQPGAGILFDLSPHLVDQAIQFFGFPKALFADVWTMRNSVPAPDYFELLLFYEKLRVRLIASCIARESKYAYTLHGMKGSFLQQRSDLQEQQLQLGVKPSLENWCPPLSSADGFLHTELNGELVKKETTSIPGNYMGYYDDVYKALTEMGANPVPSEDGIKNMRIIDAALQSVKEARIIHF